MSNVKDFLIEILKKEALLYKKKLNDNKIVRIKLLAERWSNDQINSEIDRFEVLNKHIQNCKEKRILDMSSGCGSFVIQGLQEGYDLYGIEPEDWKHRLIDLKFIENSYSKDWRNRIKQGVGENLPFEDHYFDAFHSWQTFEHVNDVSECLNELYRALKPGGKGIIHCPSYLSFYESHYRMFWLPMLGNNLLGRLYLKINNRPIEGLRTFNPINHKILKNNAIKAGFIVEDIGKKSFYENWAKRIPKLNSLFNSITLFLLFRTHNIYNSFKRFGRYEKSIHLLLTKSKNG